MFIFCGFRGIGSICDEFGVLFFKKGFEFDVMEYDFGDGCELDGTEDGLKLLFFW